MQAQWLKSVFLLTSCIFIFACSSSSSDDNESSTGAGDASGDATRTAATAKFEPAHGQVLVFVGQDNGSVGANDDIALGGMQVFNDGYVEHLGVPAGITHYVYFAEGATNAFGFSFDVGTVDGLNTNTTWGAGRMCMVCYLNSSQLLDTIMHISISMEFNSEDRVADGSYDHLSDELATFLMTYSHVPFLIRIGYEFDGPWNGYDADNYRQAFQRIVDNLRTAGVTNYATVMASSTMFVPVTTWDSYYPGDDYVDWVGYSYFGGGLDSNAPALRFARAHNKPIFIAEAAPRGSFLDLIDPDAQWNIWFAPLFRHIEENPDVIKALSYINADWDSQPMWTGRGWGDTRIQLSDSISQRWRNKMNESRYRHGTQGLYSAIGFSN